MALKDEIDKLLVKLDKLETSKKNIEAALISKGGEVPSGAPFQDYASILDKVNSYNANSLVLTKEDKKLPTSTQDTSRYIGGYVGIAGLIKSIDLANINLKMVENTDYMFSGCLALESIDLSTLDTSKCTDMREMFDRCHSLKEINLSKFNTEKVRDMWGMFSDCLSLTNLDFSSFKTPALEEMGHMFDGCIKITNLDLSTFNMAKVRTLEYLFANCSLLQTVVFPSGTDVACSGTGMFSKCVSLPSMDFSNVNLKNLESCDSMFFECKALTNVTLGAANFNHIKASSKMFEGCSALTSIDFSNSGFNSAENTNTSFMFKDCTALTNINVTNFTTNQVMRMSGMFENCSALSTLNLSSFNTNKLVNAERIFKDCINLSQLDITNFVPSLIEDMSRIFENCKLLGNIDLSSWTCSPTNTEYSFRNCESMTTIELATLNLSLVENCGGMFEGCKNVSAIGLPEGSFSACNSLMALFKNCEKLNNVLLSNINSSNVLSTESMFAYNGLIQDNLSDLNTTNVTNMMQMFEFGTWNEANISLDMGNVKRASYMFRGCKANNITIASAAPKIEYIEGMFEGCKNLTSADISTFTGIIKNAEDIFKDATALVSVNISNIDTSKITSFNIFTTSDPLINFDKLTTINWPSNFGSNRNFSTLDLSKCTALDDATIRNLLENVAVRQAPEPIIIFNKNIFDTVAKKYEIDFQNKKWNIIYEGEF